MCNGLFAKMCFVSDIDECAMNHTYCHMNATCYNKNGSFECICNNGTVGNGTHCGMYVFFNNVFLIDIFLLQFQAIQMKLRVFFV